MKLSELLDTFAQMKFKTEEAGDIISDETFTFPDGSEARIAYEAYDLSTESGEYPDGLHFLRQLVRQGAIADPEVIESAHHKE